MSDNKRIQLSNKIVVCKYIAKDLLSKINILEANQEIGIEEKLSELKKIKEEISKVGMEIDNIKKEITLLDAYSLN